MIFILFQLFASVRLACFSMPRNKVPKKAVPCNKQAVMDAFHYRVRTGCSLKQACEEYNIAKTTLSVSQFFFF